VEYFFYSVGTVQCTIPRGKVASEETASPTQSTGRSSCLDAEAKASATNSPHLEYPSDNENTGDGSEDVFFLRKNLSNSIGEKLLQQKESTKWKNGPVAIRKRYY